ncbi:lipase family protein [Pedobacter sp. MC2016-24]|uniref:lipase family protein n=1 Tax=Pedobacter sp. MC2016-24 TaxID=2780090 RepID=UPI00187E7B04|nr:lipase family protein [Pedobacter sp. MC2016-24]MBE9601272.1 lipase family protein [Pedobacter sp. MC2016-24]
MKNKSYLLILLLLAFSSPTFAQYLKPGFDKQEYIELMKISARFGDTSYSKKIPAPADYDFAYRSPVVGLDNCWDLWISKGAAISKTGVAVISLRGTTQNSVSWLANFYAAMVPAKGELHLSDSTTFKYELAANPKAAIHAGWIISTAFLSKSILGKIDSCYKNGIKEFIIMGHSQGGAIAYLLTSYLLNLQKNQQIAGDIRFKTYCSAAPKPGNLYYAYEYEAQTQNGWAYNVVNAADWVPETPMSVQTLDDFNVTNPFVNAKSMIKKQPFTRRLALNYMFNRMDKPTRRAQKNYQKYLGTFTSKMVRQQIPGFIAPAYYNSSNYVRTGNTIVLFTDEDYYKRYPDNETNVFVHHLHPAYLYLTEKLKN